MISRNWSANICSSIEKLGGNNYSALTADEMIGSHSAIRSKEIADFNIFFLF